MIHLLMILIARRDYTVFQLLNQSQVFEMLEKPLRNPQLVQRLINAVHQIFSITNKMILEQNEWYL